jgi:two-component system, cell cycle response regulator DivK
LLIGCHHIRNSFPPLISEYPNCFAARIFNHWTRASRLLLSLLVVEDFKDLRELISFYLSARGYRVLEARNGEVAVEAALRGNVSLILLKLRLPDMSGLEVARQLRKSSNAKRIPIIGWSADAPSKSQQYILRQAGIVGYLQKPATFQRTRCDD